MEKVEDVYELSGTQRGILFECASRPEQRSLYVVQLVATVAADLDVARLESAFRVVLARTPALRTAFFWQDRDRPLQLVFREYPFCVEVRRESAGDVAGFREAVRRFAGEERRRGFDLARPLLLRVAVIRTEHGSALVLTIHHLLLDGWSMGHVLHDVIAVYEHGAAARLPPRPPYREFIRWLQKANVAEATLYWNARLRRVDSSLLAPTFPRAPRDWSEIPASARSVELGPETARALRDVSRELRVTLNSLVEVAWGILLARHLGRNEIVFGTVGSGRPPELPGSESMIGLFINTLPCRFSSLESSTVRELILRHQASRTADLHYSFLSLSEALSAHKGGARTFDTLIAFENYPAASTMSSMFGEVKVTEASVEEGTEFPFEIRVLPAEGNLHIDLLLGAGIEDDPLASACATEVFRQFGVVLRGLSSSLGARVGELLATVVADSEVVLGERGGSSSAASEAVAIEGFGVVGTRAGTADESDAVFIRLPSSGDRPRVVGKRGAALPLEFGSLAPRTTTEDGGPSAAAAARRRSASGAVSGAPLARFITASLIEVTFGSRWVQVDGMWCSLEDRERALTEASGQKVWLWRESRPSRLICVLEGSRAEVDGRSDSPLAPAKEDARDRIRALLPRDLAQAAPLSVYEWIGPAAPTADELRRRWLSSQGELAAGGPRRERRADLEHQLGTFWREVLKVPEVTASSDFFALGGHSLSSMQVAARARRTWGNELAIAEFFLRRTLREQAEYVAETLATTRRALLPPLVPRAGRLRGEDSGRLSLGQLGFWYQAQLFPRSGLLNVPVVLEVSGPLDEPSIVRALGRLIERHPALRTRFVQRGAEAFQEVAGEAELALERLEGRVTDFCERPFDLARAPLLRAGIAQDAEHTRLAIVLHHIVVDGWSLGILLSEFAALYNALAAGRSVELPRPTFSPIDYARWQRELLDSEQARVLRAAWRAELAGAPSFLELPASFPRPAVFGRAGETHEFELEQQTVARLRELVTNRGFSVFQVLVSAFAVFLSRITNQTDIVIGTLLAGRSAPELERVAGLFVNTIPLRLRVPRGATFVELLEATRGAVMRAHDRQDYPFEQLVQDLQIEHDPSRTPLFQVFCIVQNTPLEGVSLRTGGAPLAAPGAQRSAVSAVAPAVRFANFDLTLNAIERESGPISCRFEYNAEIFDAPTIARWAGIFASLLDRLLQEAPEATRLDGVPTAPGARRVLSSPEPGPAPEGPTFIEAFERAVRRGPSRLAATDRGTSLSYAELDRASLRVAEHLRARGVRRETPVALVMDRSVAFLVSLVAILRSGGAYVPILPKSPREYARLMLEQAGCKLVLTRAALAAELSGWGVPLAIYEEAASRSERREPCTATESDAADDVRRARPTPDSLAYILFTSGSTGVPKGAMVHHGGMFNHLAAKCESLALTEADVVAQTTTQSFDVAIWQFLAPLCVGGRVAIFEEESAWYPESFFARIAEDHPTVIETVPSHLSVLTQWVMDRAERPALESVRFLMVTGEAFPAPLAREWHQLFPRIPLVNAYGPTECSDDVTHGFVSAGQALIWPTVPIGKALRGQRLYVLDADLAFVPEGVVGELYVGGRGVGLGYVSDPVKTAAAFMPDPYGEEAGARMYRTGDLVREIGGGELLFVGRNDEQVKIRGVRIELGEVESALLLVPHVKAAAAVVVGNGREKELWGFCVTSDPAAWDVSLVRDELRKRVPLRLIPSRLVQLSELPLTPNGKVDRASLQKQASERVDEPRALEPPRTEQEREVLKLWSEVLGLEASKLGVEDDFFEAGGNSLQSLRLLGRLQKTFGVALTLRQFAEGATVRAVSRRLANAASGGGAAARALRKVPRDRPWSASGALPGPGRYPLSYAQERMWFLSKLEGGDAAYNVALVLDLEGRVDVDCLRGALDDVMARHTALRLRIVESDGEAYQREGTGTLALGHEVVSEPGVRGAVERELRRGFRVGDAEQPLVRATLFERPGPKYTLLWVFHHAIVDGWSVEILERELGEAYTSRQRGGRASWAELPYDYIDYAFWQREHLTEEVIDRHLSYWRSYLGGELPVLSLPSDRPRKPVKSFAGDTYEQELGPELSSALKQYAQQARVTLFVTLLGAYGLLLTRLGGQREVVVGTPHAGRTHAEMEGVVGLFVNTLAHRVRPHGEETFDDYVKRLQAAAFELAEHHEVPFERVVEALRVRRDPSHDPVFQTMLVLEEASDEEVAVAGARLTATSAHQGVSKFDLTLTARVSSTTGIGLRWEYCIDLFERASIARFGQLFRDLLRRCLEQAGSGVPLRSLRMLDADAERAYLRRVLSLGSSVPASASCVDLIRRTAREFPERCAIQDGSTQVSYRAFEQRSDAIAGALVRAGVQAEDAVAVVLPRGAELALTLVGILKAGGVYVPIALDLPPERRRALCEAARAKYVVTSRDLGPRGAPPAAPVLQRDESRAAGSDARVVFIEDVGAPSSSFSVRPARRDQLAYILFTSGSMGAPEAAGIAHGSLATHLLSLRRELRLGPGSRVAQTTAAMSDPSIFQMLGPLVCGGTTVIADDQVTRTATALIRWLGESRASVCHLASSLLPLLAGAYEELEPGPDASELRFVLAFGDVLPREAARRWLTTFPKTTLVHVYGPTEAAIHVAHAQVRSADDVIWPTAPIGKALGAQRLYVLDGEMNLVPEGVAGELYVGGLGVDRGDVSDAAGSAAAFVPDPYSEEAGARMYRTGDLVREIGGGELLFVGRSDEQMTVHGVRIELGEVESALLLVPHVKAAAAVVVGNGREKELWGFCVTSDPAAWDVSLVRDELRKRVPLRLIPSRLVQLSELPLTPNGKVDRASLQKQASERVDEPRALEPPRTEQEREVLKLWSEVLGLEASKLGVEDDFFEAGGNSLQSLRLLGRLQKTFGVALTLRQFAEGATVRAVSRRLANAASGGGAAARALRKVPRDRPWSASGALPGRGRYPLSYAQERMWFLSKLEGGDAAYNVALVLDLEGRVDVDCLRGALDDVMARHTALRLRIVESDGEAYQREGAGTLALGHEVVSEPGAREAVERELRRGFRVGDAEQPLVRATLFERPGPKYTLLWVFHHAIVDGWSVEILERELGEAYTSRQRGGRASWAELPYDYIDYAFWQREHLTEEVIDRHLSYWRSYLGGELPVLSLPSDRPRKPVKSFAGDTYEQELGPELSSALKQYAQRARVTLFVTLLGAYGLLLTRLGGQREVVVGTPHAGRTHAEMEGVVGLFVNTLAHRVRPHDEETFDDYVKRLQAAAFELAEHHEVPFERVVEALRVRRDPSHDPVFQTMLVIEETLRDRHSQDVLGLRELSLSPAPARHGTSKFDLSLNVRLAESGIHLEWEYATDLFDEGTIVRFARLFRELLHQVTTRSEVRLGELSLPGAEELRRAGGQVDLRGYRVDLGAIEAALAAHPGVREAAVVAVPGPAEARLVAHVVTRGDPPSAAALRALLGEQLPAYMLPTSFRIASELPRLASGERDLQALIALGDPGGTEASQRASRVAPRDEIERLLVCTWEEVLGVRPIGVNQNFFELGGHSLGAMQLMSRIEKAVGHALPRSIHFLLFRSGTIEHLAAAIHEHLGRLAAPHLASELAQQLEARGARPGDTSGVASGAPPAGRPRFLVRLSAEGDATPLFLVHPVGGSVFCYRDLAAELTGFAVHALQSSGFDASEEILTDVPSMARAYVKEIRAVQPSGPYLLGGWSFGSLVAFEMARILRADREDATVLVIDGDFENNMLPSFDDDLLGSLPGAATLDAELRASLEKIFDANGRALVQYHPGTSSDIPLHLFLSERTHWRGLDAVEASWRGVGSVKSRTTFPTDHYGLLRPPILGDLARTIRARLR
ncbi:amino acid adenylation domain-containing protein [Sorangium sp. So ce131]|uniref:amino acid adenylation domain-containing protein n=1 Tax=Sorangium sp. So ce131 TaxID=3133282 RepID=UPI003F613866